MNQSVGTQDRQTVEALNRRFAKAEPQEILQWALTALHPHVALASSFGAEDVALIDMMVKIRPDARVVTLDTGRLPQETYEVIDAIREKYGVIIEAFFPQADQVESFVRREGVNAFYRSIELRKACCQVRKVEPLGRALTGLKGWITGLRRDQAVTRGAVQTVEWDADHGGLYKINPLAAWSSDQVWAYLKAHGVPYNVLHDRGYPSLGCAPCTRAVKPGEDPRAGRWWWEQPEQKECGLHRSAA